MARSRLCRCCKDFHDLDKPWPHNCLSHFGVVARDAPFIRPDGMDVTENPVNGLLYDSKSAYYAAVEAAGCHIVEAGSWGRPRQASGPPVRETMKRVLEQLSNR